MQKLLTCVVTLAPIAFLAACTVTNGLGQESGRARLPTGVTLLDSDEDTCGGVVHLDDGSARAEVVVRQGQNATFEVDEDEELEWTCVGESEADSDDVDCPDDTTHVRVTRAASGNDLLFECYGRR